jgi:hypothetical protein
VADRITLRRSRCEELAMTTVAPHISADRAERIVLNAQPSKPEVPEQPTLAKAAAEKAAQKPAPEKDDPPPPNSRPVSSRAAAHVGRTQGSPTRALAAAATPWLGQITAQLFGGPTSTTSARRDPAVERAADELIAMDLFERSEALDARIETLASSDRNAAVELVARLAERDARGLGETITLGDGDERSEEVETVLADGLNRAHGRAGASTNTMPYVSAREQMARDLAQGLSDGLPQGANPDTGLAAIIGRTGNDALQAQFVRSGLYIANANAASNARGGIPGPSYYLAASLAPAVQDSALAAQEVIRFAETNDVSFSSSSWDPIDRGANALATILETFQTVGTDRPDGQSENAFITFMRAANSGAIGDQQAFTLFLAVSSREGLIQADGIGGKSNPEATALTAQLFERYYDRWIDPNGLNITELGSLPADGVSGKFGGLYDGFDIGGSFTRFFKEALIDKNERGDYRAGLTAFVLERIFQAYGTNTPLATLFGSSGQAAANSASLLDLLGNAEGDLLKDLASASAENKKIISFLIGGGFAVLGAAGGPAGSAAGASAGQALVKYMMGKAQGEITEGLASYLSKQGIDADQIRAIQNYLGNPAAVAQALQANLGDTTLSPQQLTAFINTFESHLAGDGTAKALETALETLNNDFGDLSPAQRNAIEAAIRELQEVK